ncbi:hypothetical protein [Sporomusa sp.]|uniref:hypothetical protein n=1 Tax=Sporomusa sp. TaxID=2078658 RepID=UPI002D7E67EF|nr:hypothetical protein [Sporomusa sp.]
MGNARIGSKADRPAAEEVGLMLFAEGLSTEVELAAELVPDLISEDRAARKK